MLKRKITFGSYDTAVHGWTLTGWTLSPAEQKTNYVDKTGGDGSWDMSTALSDGLPRYKDRQLTATFECSEGDQLSREAKIRHMVNLLDGMREQILLPDDDDHYVTGRLHVVREYNNLAHGSVTVTATCEPWKFCCAEKAFKLVAAPQNQTARLVNNGRRPIVPTLYVEDASASVQLTSEGLSVSLGAGTHRWPDLLLTPGAHELTYRGTGTVTISYREAVLE